MGRVRHGLYAPEARKARSIHTDALFYKQGPSLQQAAWGEGLFQGSFQYHQLRCMRPDICTMDNLLLLET